MALAIAGRTALQAQQQIVAPIYSNSAAQPYLVAANAETSAMPTVLPEAPSAVMAESSSSSTDSTLFMPTVPQAPRYAMVIGTGAQAQPLSAGGKVAITLKDTFSVESLIGITLSAGYSDVTNGQPNYGRNAIAFGKRFGAAAARDSSEEVFSYAVFAPVLHQDPRYYREGSGHNFLHRTAYAVTRTLVTRTDSGRQTVNASLLLGYAGAGALSTVYYPQINRNFHDEAAAYGGSLAGEALYFVFSEFFAGAHDVIHLHTAQ